MEKKIITGILLCVSLLMCAQKKDTLRYGGMQQFNLTFGQSGPGIGLTVVNGVRYQRFFAGIGADYLTSNYNHNATSAIYLDGRYYINKRKNFFVKLGAGVNLITERMSAWYASEFDRKAGYYWGTGIGLKAKIGKEMHYLFDVSYVVRQTRYDFRYQDWRIPAQWLTEKYDNRRPMIVVSLGFEVF